VNDMSAPQIGVDMTLRKPKRPVRALGVLLGFGLGNDDGHFADGLQYAVRGDHASGDDDRLRHEVLGDLSDLRGLHDSDDLRVAIGNAVVVYHFHLEGLILEHGFSFRRVSLYRV